MPMKLAACASPVAEVIYRSERTVVARLSNLAGGVSVIEKRLLGPDALGRMRHEARMLERLERVAGVARLLSTGPGAALILADGGLAPLEGAGRLAPGLLVGLARHLARILADMHRRGVLHLDISPANILQAPAGGPPELIDFHLATMAAEDRRSFTHHSGIAGTLAYIAPELTGRVAQTIDQRADLYQLGATLYEFATGAPPFGRGDAFRLVRDHVASMPVPPSQLCRTLPPLLSDIILRLLEKEPDRRYQSADGLADDLDRLHAAMTQRGPADFPLGLSDFPSRLAAPSRLIGREPELAQARAAVAGAQAGTCRLLLVSGGQGVGKTALIDQMRSIVAAQGGWFAASRFEQYRQDGQTRAVNQLIRKVVALLLAEPDDELAAMRARLAARLGGDLGLLLQAVPELEAVTGRLEVPPGASEAGLREAALALLQAVASPARPLLLVLDHLQWAPDAALGMIDTLLAAGPCPGLLLVCGYRDAADSPALGSALLRWQQAAAPPRRLHLANLPPPALAAFVADMLRLTPQAARPLADAVGARTHGNPFDSVELLNALRRDKTLFRGPEGWRWSSTDIRRHVGQGEVCALLHARIAALPDATQDVLADMAFLGSEVSPALLAAARATSSCLLEAQLSPALEDGLLVLDHGPSRGQAMLRFRNHRVQQALHDGMGTAGLPARQLALARRLAHTADFEIEAAEQYLPNLAEITTAREASRAAALFAGAGDAAARLFRHRAAERYYGAAATLQAARAEPDIRELTRLRTARLTALYSLGQHDDADRLFAEIGQHGTDPLVLAEASCVQVLSLCNRGHHAQAMEVGLGMLARLGISRPDTDLAAWVSPGLAGLTEWVRAEAAKHPADLATTDDPLVRAASRLISRILPTAQLFHPLTGAWLAVETQRLWATHGACPELVVNLARSGSALIVFGEDYEGAYTVARHAVGVGAAAGYEPETSLARQNFATFAIHWFERLERTLDQAEAARPSLIKAGEIQAVCINDISSLAALLDCAPTLEVSATHLATARDFTVQTGNTHLSDILTNHHHLLAVMTGDAEAATRLAQAPDPGIANKPLATFGFHCSQALIAALFADDARLATNSAAAASLTPRIGGAYRCTMANLLHALSLARQQRQTGQPGATQLPAAFHTLRAWFAARAADAPCNFAHLLNFIDAEAAWTEGDTARAARAFDRALQSCVVQTRPWHHALIAERAGLFHLAHGLDYAGRALLRDAQARYAAWGAPGVVRRLTATHGFLDARESQQAGRPASISSDDIDLLAILRASQALSSQRTIGALYAQVVETLAAMTGATSVQMVVWDESLAGWCLPARGDQPAEPVEAAAARRALPLSVLRTVERTQAPLVIDDARLDDRFARDPYVAGLARCSMLALPVQSQGAARAVLILENHLSRGVFSRARVDLVTLVASQLAVSLDNARLYASLEQRVAERTETLAVVNRRLEQLSISDALTGLANRRRFDDVLASEWLRALRGSTSLGLVLVDVDHFKRYNDHYGHVGGDRCLRAVATAIQAVARQDVDLAARYGGEEFALILPGADLRGARAVATRARDAVLALREPHAASPLHCVTISLGAAALVPRNSVEPAQFLQAADAALYCAKQQGRNRVVTQDEDSHERLHC